MYPVTGPADRLSDHGINKAGSEVKHHKPDHGPAGIGDRHGQGKDGADGAGFLFPVIREKP